MHFTAARFLKVQSRLRPATRRGLTELLRVAVHGSFCADPEAGTCHATHKAIQHADETLRLHMLCPARRRCDLRRS